VRVSSELTSAESFTTAVRAMLLWMGKFVTLRAAWRDVRNMMAGMNFRWIQAAHPSASPAKFRTTSRHASEVD